MKIEELRQECEQALRLGSECILLVLPKGASSRIKGFPRGELMCERYDGSRVFLYDAKRVLKALEKIDAD